MLSIKSIIIALSCISLTNGFDLDMADDAFSLTAKVFEYVTKTWEIADKVEDRVGDDKAPVVWFTKKKERMILHNFGVITELLQSSQKDTADIRFMMLSSLKKLQNMPNVVLNGIQVNELLESVRSLENDYKTMEEKFADAMLEYSPGSPHKQLSKIHTFIVPQWEGFNFHTYGGIFNILHETLENSDMLCDRKQSLQQLIFNLYMTLHLTQLKGFSVMQFSWMLLQTYGKGNFTFERKKQKDQFEDRIKMQLNILKKSMSSANNMYWRCDPPQHKLGETYLEVTQLLQGYIENEVDMNTDQNCFQNCAYYDVAEHKSCFKDQFCSKQHSCNGRILNCQYFDSDMRICQAPFGSNRRYDYIEYENGRVLGDKSGGCKGASSKVDSWWRYLVYHCSYCFCICDSSERSSDRYFSLHPSLSDISKNKVVTGLRFHKIKQMFHLQVEEGIIGPHGSINESSRQWVDLPGPEFTYQNKTLLEGVDYHALSYTSRSIDLDNVMAPQNMVVTGVKFRMIGSHLNIEVRVTPYDFITGNLIEPNEKSYWIGNENTEFSKIERMEIDINNSDLPTKANTPFEPDVTSNKFLMFTHSSIDHDVAQTTLPYIDKQTVAPYPAAPLSGVGIYFKGLKGYAGFIGANVFTYDFSKDINFDLFITSKK
ncbi:uncharacterized protein LOC126897171 isoform X2 [Daktulosphaira vitifoliae]|uniref:uncharacterized protein LOC126897171 isoform X2 n=1 Tax=Daktulosphaira vitifoliae TaxID=58002 RepID=UPI0021A9B42C|nr:uncharacterized protein LOC126897171 isoform X2 [Daktulosphaira vitifoliae]